MFSFILFWEPLDTFPVGRGRIEALPLPVHQDRVPSPVFVDFFCQLSKGIIGIFSFLIGAAIGRNLGDISPGIIGISQGEGRKVPIISGDIADLLDLICGLLSGGDIPICIIHTEGVTVPRRQAFQPIVLEIQIAVSAVNIGQGTIVCSIIKSENRTMSLCLHQIKRFLYTSYSIAWSNGAGTPCESYFITL